MKKVIFVFICGFIALFLLYSFGNGPARRNHDKTGSPLSDGKCTQCHSAGKYNVDLKIQMLDGDQEVNEYMPGHRYKFKYTVKHTGNPSKYGFQTVFLDSQNNGVGQFDSIKSGFQVSNLKNIDYVEHSSPSPLEFMSFDWIAPEEGVGDISIYFGGIAANGNGGNSGDGGSTMSLTIKESTTSYSDIADEKRELIQLNNPVSDKITIKFLSQEVIKGIRIFSISGDKIYEGQTSNAEFEMNISSFPKGLYIASIKMNKNFYYKKFIKI